MCIELKLKFNITIFQLIQIMKECLSLIQNAKVKLMYLHKVFCTRLKYYSNISTP